MKWGKSQPEFGAEKESAHRLWFTHDLLERAMRGGGCIICGALRMSERKSIHSFLYEGMMSPLVRRRFLDGEGFCARHFAIAREIEDECWPEGGIGVAILCQDLVRQVSGRVQHLH
jgi:hypothetical protein